MIPSSFKNQISHSVGCITFVIMRNKTFRRHFMLVCNTSLHLDDEHTNGFDNIKYSVEQGMKYNLLMIALKMIMTHQIL